LIMYKYLVGIVLLLPLIGIIMVERGAFAASVGIFGYANGAGIAYAVYASVVVLVAWISNGQKPRLSQLSVNEEKHSDFKLKIFGVNLLLVNAAFLLIFLFGFGAINVWTGIIGKGEFRVGLGIFGAFPNLMTKFVLPAFLAYATSLYLKSSKSRRLQWLMVANFTLLFIIGASWGFKTTGFVVLLPALMIIYWKISIMSLLKLSFAFVAVVLMFFYIFDAGVQAYADVGTFLFTRVTVIQGDVAWYVWDKYITGQDLPNYWPTLLAAFGGNILTVFGLSRSDFYNWIYYHYDLLITYVAKVPLDQIENGHSVTATPFAEGLVAGGVWGIIFFSVIAGLIVGRLHSYIRRSLAYGHHIRAAVAATYFCFYVFSWLNGGAVVQLFHISLWIALFITLCAFKGMLLVGKKPKTRVPYLPVARSV